MRFGIGFRSLLLGSAMASVVAGPAQSADKAPAAPSASAPAGSVPAQPVQPAQVTDQASDVGQLQDIVVTATRRETNLQSTPISISVLNAAAIQDRHVLSLFNLADGSVPSLRVATFEARQSALTIGIRGIVPYDQNQTARDGGVSVYIDGVALGKTQGLNAALFDIERIEVLKGPQGTLFGRNTEGGALSLVTKAPTGVFDGRVVAGVGNYGSRNAELHLDLPSFANVALKFDGVYQHQDPTVKDPLSGSIGWNAYDRKGGRAAARWTPIEGLTADFSYDYAKDDNTPNFSQLVSYNPNGYTVGSYTNPLTGVVGTQLFLPGTPAGVAGTACGGTIRFDSKTPVCIASLAPIQGVHPERQRVSEVPVPQQYSTDITHGLTANLKYKIAPEIELRSITAWRGVSTDQWDNSGGTARSTFAPNANVSRYSLSFLKQHQFSQEFQAVGSFSNLDYVVGAYYFMEHATEYAATPLSNQFNANGTAVTVRNPVIDSSATGAISSANSGYQQFAPSCTNSLAASNPQFANSCQFITRDSESFDHNYSVFGNLTYNLGSLHLTAGGRYTKDKRHGRLFIINNAPQPFVFSNSIDRVDPMFNVAFDASQDVHFYAKYSTGFRAGGANDRSQAFNAFGPESVKSYEVGAKMDFLDHRARLNLAGYIMDRTNTQFDFDQYDTAAGSPTNGSHIEQTQNAGVSKIRGIEADLTVRPMTGLTLGASYAYTYWKAPSAVNPLTGGAPQQLYIVYTPKNAASGTIDYELPVGGDSTKLRFHLDGNYSSSQYSFQLEPTKTDANFVMNGRIALADIAVNDHNKVTVSVWARNLLNTTYIYRRSAANSSPVINYCPTTGAVNGVACTPNAAFSTAYGGVLGDYANFNNPRTWGLEIAAKF